MGVVGMGLIEVPGVLERWKMKVVEGDIYIENCSSLLFNVRARRMKRN